MMRAILLSLLPVISMGAPFYADKLNLLTYIDDGGEARAIQAPEEWAIRRGHILANMQLVMGPLPDEPRDEPPAVSASEELETGKWIRQKITYEVAPGDRVPAFLFLPKGVRGKRPAMLCLHQTIEIGKGEPAGLGDQSGHLGDFLAQGRGVRVHDDPLEAVQDVLLLVLGQVLEVVWDALLDLVATPADRVVQDLLAAVEIGRAHV